MSKIINSGPAFSSTVLHEEQATIKNKTIDEGQNNIVLNSQIALRKLIYELMEMGFEFKSQEILDELNKLEDDNS